MSITAARLVKATVIYSHADVSKSARVLLWVMSTPKGTVRVLSREDGTLWNPARITLVRPSCASRFGTVVGRVCRHCFRIKGEASESLDVECGSWSIASSNRAVRGPMYGEQSPFEGSSAEALLDIAGVGGQA
jgi:hypothetical protein